MMASLSTGRVITLTTEEISKFITGSSPLQIQKQLGFHTVGNAIFSAEEYGGLIQYVVDHQSLYVRVIGNPNDARARFTTTKWGILYHVLANPRPTYPEDM